MQHTMNGSNIAADELLLTRTFFERVLHRILPLILVVSSFRRSIGEARVPWELRLLLTTTTESCSWAAQRIPSWKRLPARLRDASNCNETSCLSFVSSVRAREYSITGRRVCLRLQHTPDDEEWEAGSDDALCRIFARTTKIFQTRASTTAFRFWLDEGRCETRCAQDYPMKLQQ